MYGGGEGQGEGLCLDATRGPACDGALTDEGAAVRRGPDATRDVGDAILCVSTYSCVYVYTCAFMCAYVRVCHLAAGRKDQKLEGKRGGVGVRSLVAVNLW